MSSTAAHRTERLIVREVEDETVVYDLDNEQVTCLDVRTAAVWQAADGRTSVGHVARRLDMSQDDVAMALVRLDDAGLMKDAGGMSRRTVLKGLGVGAAVVPLMTVMAPPAWAACSATPSITITGQGCGTTPSTRNDEIVTFSLNGFASGTVVNVTAKNTAGTTTFGTASVTPGSDCTATGTITFGGNSFQTTQTVTFTATQGTTPVRQATTTSSVTAC